MKGYRWQSFTPPAMAPSRRFRGLFLLRRIHKAILPGVITHASNIVEHPELIAERLVRFAERVGRENVIASADCGFSSQACYKTEVDPRVIWAKFQAMREGAEIASKKLW